MIERKFNALRRGGSTLAISLAIGLAAAQVVYADTAPIAFNITAKNTAQALMEFSRQARVQILFPYEEAARFPAPTLKGDLSRDETLARLLQGTSLVVASVSDAVITLKVRDKASAERSYETSEPPTEVVVTGSRIRGAAPAAPVIVLTDEEIRLAGQSDLGEAIRSLSQNYNGGQNPGVGFTQGALGNSNTTSGSKPNLRGLGADATLTLLNGHRLPDDGSVAGVDISTIPLSAISKIEVLADGSSALYGSDAVGGVINVTLKRRFEGVALSGRLGQSTDGGNVQRQMSLVSGYRSDAGGLVVALDLSDVTRIRAADRDYTANMNGENTLFPAIERQNLVVSGFHDISDTFSMKVDALYSKRTSEAVSAAIKTQPVEFEGVRNTPSTEAFSIATQFDAKYANGWRSSLLLQVGKDDAQLTGNQYYGGVRYFGALCYCNTAASAEFNGEGGLFTLPGGTARLAVGAGLRANRMDYWRVFGGNSIGQFDVRRHATYAFAELFLPWIAPENNIPGIRKLSLTLAGRYENYRDLEEVSTPKVGLVWEPVSGLAVKASWGESFKAPSFVQQYSAQTTTLRPITGYGTAFPTGATYITLSGGNPSLKPERAETLTATLQYRPGWASGFSASLSYFEIDYTDKIVALLTSYTGVLTNPRYADMVTFNPARSDIDTAIAEAALGLTLSGNPSTDLSRVKAIVDNRNRNASSQKADGIDLSMEYGLDLGADRSLDLSLGGSYLNSRQQVSPGQPYADLAGTLFNPSHLRLRAGTVYRSERFTLAGYLSHTSALDDVRRTPVAKIDSRTIADVTASYRVTGLRNQKGMEISLAVLNLTNSKPPLIYTSYGGDTPFDSTNYSAIGRYVGVTLSQRW
jgi:outer membrane receptor protein involved in Fe transport